MTMRTAEQFAGEALSDANYINDPDQRYKTLAYIKLALAFLSVIAEYLRRK